MVGRLQHCGAHRAVRAPGYWACLSPGSCCSTPQLAGRRSWAWMARPILTVAAIIATLAYGGGLIFSALYSNEGKFEERFRMAREIFLVFSGHLQPSSAFISERATMVRAGPGRKMCNNSSLDVRRGAKPGELERLGWGNASYTVTTTGTNIKNEISPAQHDRSPIVIGITREDPENPGRFRSPSSMGGHEEADRAETPRCSTRFSGAVGRRLRGRRRDDQTVAGSHLAVVQLWSSIDVFGLRKGRQFRLGVIGSLWSAARRAAHADACRASRVNAGGGPAALAAPQCRLSRSTLGTLCHDQP